MPDHDWTSNTDATLPPDRDSCRVCGIPRETTPDESGRAADLNAKAAAACPGPSTPQEG